LRYEVFVVTAKHSPEESQEEEMEMFKKLYIEEKGEDQFKDPQYKAIPRFYFKVNISDSVRHFLVNHYICACWVYCVLRT